MVRMRTAATVIALLLASQAWAAPAADLKPSSDTDVVETLAPRVRAAGRTPQEAAQSAREAIAQARLQADPRYLGRAQALLAPWWDQPDAPSDLAVLQATVQQSRHEFAAARKTLVGALERDPRQPQGWLTLATLERVAGRYDAALNACAQVGRTGAALYALACQLETESLMGKHDEARRGLAGVRKDARDTATQAWALSLLAESEERAGRDAAALAAYQASLALDADGYTALAAADLLLRTGKAPAALQVLKAQPASDAVLLRRARAMKAAGDNGWRALDAELDQRFAAIEMRGDDPAAHARERAMAWLWLKEDGARALESAQRNLTLQKEPLDWWLAVASAQAAGNAGEAQKQREAAAATGLRDARLAAPAKAKP